MDDELASGMLLNFAQSGFVLNVTENNDKERAYRVLACRFEKALERVSNGRNLCGSEEMADDYGDTTKLNMEPLFGAKKDECSKKSDESGPSKKDECSKKRRILSKKFSIRETFKN